jgi:hypothetical protein
MQRYVIVVEISLLTKQIQRVHQLSQQLDRETGQMLLIRAKDLCSMNDQNFTKTAMQTG